MSEIYEMPPILNGSTENQVKQLRDYLARIARRPNGGAVNTKGTVAAGSVRVSGGRKKAESAEEINKEIEDARNRAKALKALIVKTAEQQQADKAELIDAIDSVEGTTLLHIESSRGTVFKHSQISTRLTVVLFRGSERITDAATMRSVFGPGAYLQWWWQRMGDDRFWLISSDDSRLSDDGFTFTLSPSDVDTKVTFRCELVTN